eukprot:2179826-Alexandrium_andersonii.AAC.1
MPSHLWPATRMRTWLPGFGRGPLWVFSGRSPRAACSRPPPRVLRRLNGILRASQQIPRGGRTSGPPKTTWRSAPASSTRW